ncbi:hypothetical protein BH09MYX1_BH09MYX1_64170 [soil metagenome]
MNRYVLGAASLTLAAFGCELSQSGIFPSDAGPDGFADAAAGDDASDDDATSEDDASDAALDGGTEASCVQGTGGPKLVPAADYCIDSTEVTKANYVAFLGALGDGGTDAGLVTSPECSYKKTSADLVPGSWDPSTNLQRPVTKVDWCDATLFCTWAGKRLCGKRGGGSLDWIEKPNEVTKQQWYAACSAEGLRTYAYGAIWTPAKCRSDNGNQKATDVATYPSCVGGYSGLFDMTGNVAEWIDQCNGTAKNSACKSQGGDYGSNDNGSKCDSTQDRSRDDANNDWIGFRCCSK